MSNKLNKKNLNLLITSKNMDSSDKYIFINGMILTMVQVSENMIHLKLIPKGYDEEMIFNLIIPTKEELTFLKKENYKYSSTVYIAGLSDNTVIPPLLSSGSHYSYLHSPNSLDIYEPAKLHTNNGKKSCLPPLLDLMDHDYYKVTNVPESPGVKKNLNIDMESLEWGFECIDTHSEAEKNLTLPVLCESDRESEYSPQNIKETPKFMDVTSKPKRKKLKSLFGHLRKTKSIEHLNIHINYETLNLNEKTLTNSIQINNNENIVTQNEINNENRILEKNERKTVTILLDESKKTLATETKSMIIAKEESSEESITEMFKCSFCNIGFTTESSYKEHSKILHTERCSFCEMKFVADGQLNKHFMEMHQTIVKTTEDRPKKRMDKIEENGRYVSVVRKRKYYEIKREVCKICFKGISKNYMTTHMSKVHKNERPYLCSICGKSYKYDTDLVRHYNAHKNKRPYECDQCGKRFLRQNHLSVHKGNIHETKKERVSFCKICNSTFSTSTSLKKHRRTVHIPLIGEIDQIIAKIASIDKNEQLDQYVCNVCDKTMKSRGGFTCHMRTHTDTYECDHCDKIFTSPRGLSNHSRGKTCSLSKTNSKESTNHITETQLM